MLSCYTVPQIFWLLRNPWSSLRKVAQLNNQFVFIINTKTGEMFCSETREPTMDTFNTSFLQHQEKQVSSNVQNSLYSRQNINWSYKRVHSIWTKTDFQRETACLAGGKRAIQAQFPFIQTRWQEITKSTMHFQKGETSKPHLSPSASPLKRYKQPSRLPSIHLLIQKGLALMGQVSKLSHALVWLKTTHSSTKLTFFRVPGIPLCFACEVKHSWAICGWQMCGPMILLIKQLM